MTTIAERVAAGAAFLDEREPGWWERIDLELLSIGSRCNCILGQLCGSYGPGLSRYGLLRAGDSDIALGFIWSRDHEFGDGEVEDLTAEWARVITGRRAAS